MIFHVTTGSRWNEFASVDSFFPTAYTIENFIHCCKADQLPGVLQRYFNEADDLLILHLDETKLKAELKYEKGTNNELFPHLYGVINKDAIVHTEKIPPRNFRNG